jgi:hypothetical protein
VNTSTINPLTLPSLPLLDRLQLPKCSAIYFVMQDEQVLYIGQTVNLANRLASHQRWEQFKTLGESLKVAWLECSEIHLLEEIETALISYFNPPLNGSALPSQKPRITIRVSEEELEELQLAADEQYRTVPALVLVLVKKFLDERRKIHTLSPTEKGKENDSKPIRQTRSH